MNIKNMNDYLTVQPIPEQTPEFDILLGRFEQLNIEMQDLLGSVLFKVGRIKNLEEAEIERYPTKGQESTTSEPMSVIDLLEYQLENLEHNRSQLTRIYSHLQTII